jgi:hypothetical protein
MQEEEDKAKKKEMQLEKDLDEQDPFKAAQEMDRDTNQRKEQGKEEDKQEDEATKKVKLEPGIGASPDAVGMSPAKQLEQKIPEEGVWAAADSPGKASPEKVASVLASQLEWRSSRIN